MIRIRQILCPVDFSPFARRALDHAAVLARWYQAELTVLHVSPFMPTLFGMEPAVNAATLAPFDREALGRELLTFVGETVNATPRPQLVVRSGPAAATILDYAVETKADLIVLGTHGRTGFERFMLGSVTEKIVRKAPCPVLTVPRGASEGPGRPVFARILCAVDFSPASDRSTASETVLARRLLTLVPEMAGRLRDVVTHAEVAHGPVARAINEAAERLGVDVVCMASHGRTGVAKAVLGSVAGAVLKASRKPVLVVRTLPS